MPKTTLIDGSEVTPDHLEIDPNTGMQKGYVVLSEEERAKGFVRPVRRSYVHAGIRPKYELRELTAEEKERHANAGYVAYEAYPEGEIVGRFWTRAMLDSGCGGLTTMAVALAETMARDPKFYGGAFCAHCKDHFPIGEDGEFVWDGTTEKVGT
jgi:hypothetical protein